MTETVSQALLDRALIEEATKKSGLIWVQGASGPARALWHVWHDGAACVVGTASGRADRAADPADEQPLHDLGLVDGGTATVTVRSKDKGGRLVSWQARVGELAPDGEAWQAAVEDLKGKRLNAPDAETMPERWARECRVLKLTPVAEAAAHTDFDGSSQAATPLPTPATTRQPIPAALPKLLRRKRKG
ncbi:hypothetical protein CP973_34105 [Streptomyces albofaciens JCM 4342]|uniref:hypothetical protein n=1 Tax=Streptomyces albofaciens TaxID=66866 RepID=UPI00123976AD|nr:hypothetical protein [Streptomyces albofaciens]KAA6214163.1 hypothetical protein CP973_34105 [Streptomyces albofaciens JCM 4342]